MLAAEIILLRVFTIPVDVPRLSAGVGAKLSSVLGVTAAPSSVLTSSGVHTSFAGAVASSITPSVTASSVANVTISNLLGSRSSTILTEVP